MKCELPPTNAVMYMALCRSCPLNIHILKLNSLSVYTENPIFILLIKTIHYSEIKQETQGLFLQSTLFLYDTHKHSLFSFCPLSKPLPFPPTTPGPSHWRSPMSLGLSTSSSTNPAPPPLLLYHRNITCSRESLGV